MEDDALEPEQNEDESWMTQVMATRIRINSNFDLYIVTDYSVIMLGAYYTYQLSFGWFRMGLQ